MEKLASRIKDAAAELFIAAEDSAEGSEPEAERAQVSPPPPRSAPLQRAPAAEASPAQPAQGRRSPRAPASSRSVAAMAAAALQQLVAKLSCKGVKIFYQDGRGKTFSTSLEVGRNKSWAETTCYKSDTCPFVPFGIECASQDRTNPWPTGVPLDGSKGALPSRPSSSSKAE